MLIANLLLTSRSRRATIPEAGVAFARELEPTLHLPRPLDSFAIWNWLLVALMAMSWGYPILQFFLRPQFPALPWGVS